MEAQHLETDEIVTSVQEEADLVDDELNEDNDNNNNEIGRVHQMLLVVKHYSCVRDSYGVVRTTIEVLSYSNTAALENETLQRKNEVV
ncbi:hypothetical protein TNCV_3857001 [Trichonephila clavipes]|nr:hypothetical protein TNCV_3857001 [Trichonephila clavipes]